MDSASNRPGSRILRRWVSAQLTLSTDGGTRRGQAVEAARLWFELCAGRLLGESGRIGLTSLPEEVDWFSREPFAWRSGLLTWDSDDDHSGGWAVTYSSQGWAELMTRIGDLPRGASLEIVRNDERGFQGTSEVSVAMAIEPGWMVLSVDVADEVADSVAGRQDLLATMREVAERADVSSGTVFTDYQLTFLPLEEALQLSGGAAVSRDVVRDYGWLTVLAEELGQRLGGAEGLRRSGAFTEVEPLGAGGFWLLAAPDWDGYGWPEAERVFTALAPVLPPGAPLLQLPDVIRVPGTDPVELVHGNLIVPRDARDVTGD